MKTSPLRWVCTILALLGIAGVWMFVPRQEEASLDVAHWGEPGDAPGMFTYPRGVAATGDELYIVDRSGRIQVLDAEGRFLRAWTVIGQERGTPTSLLIGNEGNLIVPDTHNSRLLAYTPQGERLWSFGKSGTGTGEFCYVTAVLQTPEGRWLVAEYGEADRIQVFSPDWEFLYEFGEYGAGPGQFSRIMGLAMGPTGTLYVADSVNHRIQVLKQDGTFLYEFGGRGRAIGQMIYPYDVRFSQTEKILYVCEYGNNRIQRFEPDGRPVGLWGTVGSGEGELWTPWGIALFPDGRVAVADAGNNRITVIGSQGWYRTGPS